MKYNAEHAPVAQLDRVLGYEPRGRAFESLRAHQIVITNQMVTVQAVAIFCFSITNAGLLRDFVSHTVFAASIKLSNSAAE